MVETETSRKKKKKKIRYQDLKALKYFLSPRSKLVRDPNFTNKACLAEWPAHWAGELVSRVRCLAGPSTMMHILHYDKNFSCT